MTSLRWVLFETAPWGHYLRLPGHHLASWLVKRGHAVAYLSSPISPWHMISSSPEVKRRVKESAWRLQKDGVSTFIPRTLLPINRRWPFDSDFAWENNEVFSVPRTSRVLRTRGFGRPDVLVMHNLQMPRLREAIQPRAFVLRIEDDIEGFPNMPRVIVRREKELIRSADLVTATAESLRERAACQGARHTHLMPNGVATSRFLRPAQLPQRPSEMPEGKVALYMGAIDSWFDVELLQQVARELSDWQFVLIGRERIDLHSLKELANVRVLAPRQQEDLPPFLWHATAGLIPFLRTPLIESVCPLKLFEYLAAGLPVVSTRWDEMERLRSPAALTSSASEFAAALRRAGENRDAEGRVEWAKAFDWDRLFAAFEAEVMAMLKETEVAAH